MGNVALKILKMRELCSKHPVFGFMYKSQDIAEVKDWYVIPTINAHLGALHLSGNDKTGYLTANNLDTKDWTYVGALTTEDRVLGNANGEIYLHDPMSKEKTKVADSFYEFMDQIVLGGRYLELTGGYKDHWYEALRDLAYI